MAARAERKGNDPHNASTEDGLMIDKRLSDGLDGGLTEI
jgi:hypothetical protein